MFEGLKEGLRAATPCLLKGIRAPRSLWAMEAITPEGFRMDGRRVEEPRQVQCSVGGGREADGYAVFELGSTKAVAYVYGPMEVTGRG